MFSTGHLLWIGISMLLIVAGTLTCLRRRPSEAQVLKLCLVTGLLSEAVKLFNVMRILPMVDIAVNGAALDYVYAGQYTPYLEMADLPLELCSLQIAFIAACESGSVNLVITKSISRFARNTLDALNYIRKLKALNIPIIFEKESVNTLEASGELMVTILASIAQQESASISQNVRMGINFGFQEGRGRVNFSSFLGYRKGDKPGTYEIVPAEAEIVRRIYRQFLEGYSPKMIADGLMEDGICTPSGGEKWYPSTVASILENEKYAGDLLMQKWYVEDYLTHRCVKNSGEKPQYFVEDDHECCPYDNTFAPPQKARKYGISGRAKQSPPCSDTSKQADIEHQKAGFLTRGVHFTSHSYSP